VGSSFFVLGDYLGKDEAVTVEPCDHVQCLVEEFSRCVQAIKNNENGKEAGKANLEWGKRSLITHTIMCAIFESAMQGGVDVEIAKNEVDGTNNYVIGGETFNDIPTRDWNASKK